MSSIVKCSNCGGELVFNPKRDMLECERCGSVFPVQSSSGNVVRRRYSPDYVPQKTSDSLNNYICSSCGTRSSVGIDGEVKRCSSCGNTTLTKLKSSTIVPDGIIPFSIARDKAAEIFRRWVGSRKFAPGDLKQMAKLQKISGLYTPVYKFDFTSVFSYDCQVMKTVLNDDDIQEERKFYLHDIKQEVYQDIIKSGNTRIEEDIIENVGNYDFSKVKPYSSEYVMGFAGIDTNFDIHKAYNGILKELTEKNERKLKNKLNDEYDRIDTIKMTTHLRNVMFSHSYVPIWANHYTYKGKEYHCYINGQTGKATGSAPKSFFKIAGLIGGILLGVGAVILLLMKIL